MLPTDKASCGQIVIDHNKKLNISNDTLADNINRVPHLIAQKPQHLYIVSNAEIKEGDYVVREYYPPTKGFTRIVEQFIRSKADFGDSLSRKKIEATTDKSLKLKDWDGIDGTLEWNLPQIPQSFIEAYVKANGNIKEVNVEMEWYQANQDQNYYRIKTRQDNTIIIHPSKTYTRDDLRTAYNAGYQRRDKPFDSLSFDEWIQNNL